MREVTDIGYAFEMIRNGKSIKQKGEKGIPITRIETIATGKIDYSKLGYADISCIDEYIEYKLKENDILMSHINSIKHLGKVAIFNSKSTVIHGMNLLCLRVNPKILYARYAFQYFRSLEFKRQIPRITKKSVNQASFNVSSLKKLYIPLPSLPEQKRIVAVLDKAQELIDLRKQQIEKLDGLIQSIFYDMFGDPVVNPMGWEKGKIKDITSYTQYGTSKKANSNNGCYAILRMNNITYKGTWDLSNLKYIDLDKKEISKYLVYKNELLFNRTNSKELVGKTAVYQEEKPMAFAGYLVKLVTNSKANSHYISGYLNSRHGKQVLLNMAKSIVGMANINAEELKKIKILIPPISLQNLFAEKVKKIEEQRKIMEKSLVKLEENFKALQQMAFNGELF